MAALPVYRWRLAPDGLATRRQLRARGLRPGGQDVAAQLERPRRRRAPLVAYLYRVDLAKPVRPMTPARWAALAKANAARRTCPACRRDAGYVIPASLGMCVTCAYPEQRAA
ncbi:RRQRL motif-containing zinc-binding protein [Streptomyces sp. ALI-76-A]|uniref:RRQRL motif-containing zinc-binding protein n=1 Tax=Streptomyces sp. ALI-76-A TaxID=3025736 RepID=UPI00256F0D23|nr:RRQRL motif-containing zinc-binding protein [Streptomyces sp. ALI-76-A]MDL5203195.1 RRQRL motif-containing zinc-binding protein [Streptomyces sp. ALI-76-A]